MKSVIQRVKSTRLSVDGKTVSQIPCGLVVYLGVKVGDTLKECELTAKKIAALRRKRQNEFIRKGNGRRDSARFPVYAVRRLLARQPPELYLRRASRPCGKALRIYGGMPARLRRNGKTGRFRRGYENRAVQRRTRNNYIRNLKTGRKNRPVWVLL